MSIETDQEHVTVRMYNVGFGDAFLLAFPGRDRSARVLIDCGVHAASPRPRPISEIVTHIVESVTDSDGVPRIDLVVGTHRHRDHVSGFEHELWSTVRVGEVWMPWTEHPKDPEARHIREAQSKAAQRFTFSLQQLGADAGIVALAENALTNARAMATLHRGFLGGPARRFPSAEEAEPLESLGLEGVRVHVLGPARDPEIIRDMDPPSGEGYFRFGEGDDHDAAAAPPFGDEWSLPPEELSSESCSHLVLSKWDLTQLADVEHLTHFGLVVALEKAVNGTSLVLAFEIGDAVLLFPGDAQWGSWRRILEDENGRSLLARTTFYKVGHHGSHNATPRDFVEDVMTPRRPGANQPVENLRAMVSTHPIAMWKHIPKDELLSALRALSPQLVRSDEPDVQVPGFQYQDDLFVETRVPI